MDPALSESEIEGLRHRLLERARRIDGAHEAADVGELEAIAAALRRIDDGSYGVCARCAQPIEGSRLTALPETELCSVCAPKVEVLRQDEAL